MEVDDDLDRWSHGQNDLRVKINYVLEAYAAIFTAKIRLIRKSRLSQFELLSGFDSHRIWIFLTLKRAL